MFAGMWQLEPKTPGLEVPHATLQLIAEIDEFKGKWEALRALSPERLLTLRHVATVESIASSTRIEGVKLTDQDVEALPCFVLKFFDQRRGSTLMGTPGKICLFCLTPSPAS